MRYAKLDYLGAVKAYKSYTPWGNKHNATMIESTLQVLLLMLLKEPLVDWVGYWVWLIVTVIFFIIPAIYLFANMMLYWYYVSALHYFETHNIDITNYKEDSQHEQ